MKSVLIPLRSATLGRLSADDSEILLKNARVLQRATEPQQTKSLLRGKKLALLCDSEDADDAVLFKSAASNLGAHVSHIQPRLTELSKPEVLQHTARMLGRLYDGIECQGLTPALVEAVGRAAGVPVYDGLACAAHPTAHLASMLGEEDGQGKLRQLMLQTVLLSTLA